MKVLVASASKHGSTEGIVEAIAERLRQLGHDAAASRAVLGLMRPTFAHPRLPRGYGAATRARRALVASPERP